MQYRGFGSGHQPRPVELPQPEPGPGEILVKIAATSINPIDWKLHSGPLRWIHPPQVPEVPCLDFAGTVAALGSGAHRFSVGSPVFGMLPLKKRGAAAEYVTVGQDLAAVVPKGLDFRSAAGMPLAALTALQGLRRDGHLAAGQRLLVVGASGGVGHYAVQLGKHLGAYVAGLCSSANLELVRSLGADEVIDYRAGLPAPEQPFDLIFDAAVKQPFRVWKPFLSPAGRYISLLPSIGIWTNAWLLRLLSQKRIRTTWVKPNGQDMGFLAELAGQGSLRTVIDSVYGLGQLGEAIARSRSGRARGKIVVEVSRRTD